MMWDPPTDPRFSGCWMEWAYLQFGPFPRDLPEAEVTAKRTPSKWTLEAMTL